MPRNFEVRVAGSFWREATEAAAYIAQDSPQAAADFIGQVDAALAGLELLPLRGAPLPEAKQWKASYRQVFVHPYRVIYRVRGRTVEVLRLRYGARKAEAKEPQ